MQLLGSPSERLKRVQPDLVVSMLNGEGCEDSLAFRVLVSSEPQEKREAAIREFLDTLRLLFDQWLDSDLREPWKRNINWQSDRYPQPILERLKDFCTRNPPRWVISHRPLDGPLDIYLPDGQMMGSDLLLRSRDLAIREFIVLLESPTRQRLSRCEECRTYFLHNREPKKDEPIVHGTFCSKPSCKRKASVRRMSATRENRTKEKIELAAKWLPKWKPIRQHGKQEKWVAEMMRRTPRIFITGKWVKQHLQEIRAEVNRRKNAKS